MSTVIAGPPTGAVSHEFFKKTPHADILQSIIERSFQLISDEY